MVVIVPAGKKLATQIQNSNTSSLFSHTESLREILFALSEYNGIGIKDVTTDVFPILNSISLWKWNLLVTGNN